ncbi:hypothetical protein TL16_g09154 [Triparma laevis f. inornata]|uniref:Uncharacterized protein n=1 Tax=Triparma laevis f. inornata TaxID=1714386 RepID=A0A9W7EKP1_9STRA|nr:hypothetical protein TL16_g09154 [Triparma laevis f. inornata]
MSLSPQATRNWRILTIVSTFGIGFHTVFRTEYQNKSRTQKEHVFSGIQLWYNQVNRLRGREGRVTFGFQPLR